MRTRSATTAASRYGGLGGRLSHALAALEMRDGAGEQDAYLLWREVAIQQAVARDGDRRGLFRDDEHRRIGLFGEPERRAVTRAERFVGDLELRELQHAPRADDLIAADQDRAVGQRRVRREDRRHEVGRDLRFHRHTGGDELFQSDVPFDRDDRAGAGARQPVQRFPDLLGHRLPVAARERAHEARLAKPRQRVAQLRLEDHDRCEGAVGEHDAEQRADHRELGEHGHEVGQRQNHETDDDLQRARPDEEQQEPVDDERHEQDLEEIRPEPRRQELEGVDVHGGLVVALASARASCVSRASCTRNSRAPRSQARAQATAVARSRSSTGRPVAAPRNRLRDGPTATGYPKPTTVASSSSRRKFCSGVLANPKPGSTTIRSRATPPASARAAAAPSSAATSPATCRYTASESIVSGVPRMCITIIPAPAAPTTPASVASNASPETSFTTAAPAASAARATAALRVSTEMGPRPRRTSCSITGATRPISSSTGTGAEPGRVDSPPTSSSSHPSATNRSACATARSTVAKRPPSENESGVTFTMPMRTG